MRFLPIASGSSGNCIYVGTDSTGLLVDAGISGKRIREGLGSIELGCDHIHGVLLTHEHIDHIRGLGILARRHGIPVYLTAGTLHTLKNVTSIGKIPDGLMHVIEPDRPFEIGDIVIRAFRISHDAAEPVGFRFEHNGSACAVATDMGCFDEYVVSCLQGLDVILIESNHDLHMLQAGRYPYYLKKRIMGEEGHLSNDDCARLLDRILHDHIKQIYLGHLSEENNYEALALETVRTEITMTESPYQGATLPIVAAHRDMPGPYVDF